MAASLIGMLKQEITRIARKVVKSEVSSLRSGSTLHRRHIAALRRQVAALEKEVRNLRRDRGRGSTQDAASESGHDGALRFQARGLKSHRQRLCLSAAEYGRLVGVSSLTVYNWESGKSKPRRSQLPRIAFARTLGKREALRRLEELGEA